MDSQLAEIRKLKQQQFNKKVELEERQSYLFNKYKNLIILDKKLRSLCKIQDYLRKHFFVNPINISLMQVDEIPGLYRYRRSVITEDVPEEFKNDIEFWQVLRSSEGNPVQKNYILLDLRVYGDDPSQPFMINDKLHYLPQNYQYEIRKLWAIINPSTVSGIHFNQYLDYTKALVSIYNKK